jgi:fructose-bisphosphate aldolase class II
MLVTLNEVLPQAREGAYALPAFDCVEDVMVRAVLETLESLRTPAIIMCLVGPDMEGNGGEYIPRFVRAVADCHDIPVVLQLDHSRDLDEIRCAVDSGFSSVMYDGSALPFEENMRLTRKAVEIASPHGVTVEGELGYVGGANLAETEHTENVLTEADEVVEFVKQTGVDALAVSIGTAHGVYKAQPRLNIERLRELNEVSAVPLVLHGGSGTPDEQIREAVASGISKVNIYADNREAMARGLKTAAEQTARPDPLPRDLFRPIYDEIAAVVTHKVRLLGAENTCKERRE